MTLASSDGAAAVREAFERALTAAGLHYSEGGLLWSALEVFELRLLATLARGATGEVDGAREQSDRVCAVYRRRLAVPLLDAEAAHKDALAAGAAVLGPHVNTLLASLATLIRWRRELNLQRKKGQPFSATLREVELLQLVARLE